MIAIVFLETVKFDKELFNHADLLIAALAQHGFAFIEEQNAFLVGPGLTEHLRYVLLRLSYIFALEFVQLHMHERCLHLIGDSLCKHSLACSGRAIQ